MRDGGLSLAKGLLSDQIKDPGVALTTLGVTDCKGVDMTDFSISATDFERFFSKVDVDFSINDNKCWVWKNPLDNGYGRFWLNGRTTIAHRFAYELFVGQIPSQKHLDHLCRNRACVNPSHLEPVDIKTNVLRGVGVSAQNARKTHCKRNHLLSGENLKINTRGERVCWQCQRANHARWVAKNAK